MKLTFLEFYDAIEKIVKTASSARLDPTKEAALDVTITSPLPASNLQAAAAEAGSSPGKLMTESCGAQPTFAVTRGWPSFLWPWKPLVAFTMLLLTRLST